MRAESAEQDARTSKHGEPELENHRAMEVAQGFFWQTPGAILPYFISLVLLLILGGEHDGVGKDHLIKTQVQYMILVGSGAIPCFAIIWLQLLGLKRKHSFCSHNATGRCDGGNYGSGRTAKRGFTQIKGRNSFKVALQNRSCWKKLVGTGLCWGLYDFIYYGTAFNLPEIVGKVLGGEGNMITSSWHNLLVSVLGIPGVLYAIKMMGPMGGPKPLQAWGFVAIGTCSILVAVLYHGGEDVAPWKRWGAFAACCCLIFSLNWGCNVCNKHICSPPHSAQTQMFY
mmetsp:Transcript_12865/g.23293  ORF Transcript_12865/g.23293 Transcript_12865/m.23293 type:complete len:284 (+) Transcript_12865:877-1728(+)